MPRIAKHAPFLTWDSSKNQFRFKLINGKRVNLGTNRQVAIAKANAYNQKMRPKFNIDDLLERSDKRIPFEHIHEKILKRENLSAEVTKELRRDMGRAKEFFIMPCEQINIATCQQYLKKYHGNVSGEWFNKKIAFLNKLFKYVVAEGLIKASDNPAVGLLRDKVQDKKRQRLSVEGFEQIRNHPDSPKWLQIAMDLALQLGHGRNEILTLKFRISKPSYSENGCVWLDESSDDIHGTIYVNRKKTQKHESAHVAIPISNKLKEIIVRSQDHLKCPYIVHRKPQRKPKKMAACLDHPYQVSPELLNKQFRIIARSLPMYQHLDKEEVPTFHEIRALHAWLLKKAGYSSKDRMAQKDQRSNDLYTANHEKFVEVENVEINLNN